MSNSLLVTRVSRGARVSPDRGWVGVVAILVALAVMAFSMLFSFAGIVAVASWVPMPEGWEWVRNVSPGFIDGPILLYTVSYAIYRWRMQPKYAKHAIRSLIVLTSLSSLLNAMHVVADYKWTFTSYEVWGASLMAVLAPIGALLAAHELTRLVFIQHEDESSIAEIASETVPDVEAVLTVEIEPEAPPAPEAPPEPPPVLEAPPRVRPATSILKPLTIREAAA